MQVYGEAQTVAPLEEDVRVIAGRKSCTKIYSRITSATALPVMSLCGTAGGARGRRGRRGG